jgi:hypothetical protein
MAGALGRATGPDDLGLDALPNAGRLSENHSSLHAPSLSSQTAILVRSSPFLQAIRNRNFSEPQVTAPGEKAKNIKRFLARDGAEH